MSSVRNTGRVKWFNKKSGYGFLTVCGESPYKDKDVFAHFSAVHGEDGQYKYLVQGEYVEFDVVESKGEKHEFQAASISGVLGGLTMCDTHRENPRPLTQSRGDSDTIEPRRPQRPQRPQRSSQNNYGDNEDVNNVVRRRPHANVVKKY
jgi:cold shock CspA family protein